MHQKNFFYSVHVDRKSFVLSSTDHDTINKFNRVVKMHHRKTGKWINRPLSYTWQKNKHKLEMAESTLGYSQLLEDTWGIEKLDLYNSYDLKLVDFIYECSNMRLFLMKDFEFTEDLIRLDGYVLEKPSQTRRFELADYLNCSLEIEQ